VKRLIAAMVVLAACSGESNPVGTDGPVPTTQVYRSRTSGIASRRGEIISRQSRWVEVWDEITASASPKPPIPNVDFEQVLLVFAAGGELPDACSDARIESVTRVSGSLDVSIVEERRPTCVCPPMTIRPVHVVSVPRAATGASFSFRVANVSSCQ
jgi:hypothetical protein